LGFQVGGSGTATDPSGRPMPIPPPPNYSWHESYRYYRLSQATDDLYDAYRNLFLALESILSTIDPVRLKSNGKPDESEGAWLKRAIGTVGKLVDISRFVPTGTTDPTEYVFKDLYEDKRTALFHAKQNRAVFLPHGAAAERNSVTTSLVRLANLYLTMADAHLGVRGSRSSLSQAVYERMAHVIDGLAVTDATGDLFEQDKFIEGRRLVPLPCRWATELDDSDTRNLIGSLEVSRVGEPAVINQIVVCSSGIPGGQSRLKEALMLEGIARIEVLFSQRFKDNEPKKFYGM
jgi:hypothetical protein